MTSDRPAPDPDTLRPFDRNVAQSSMRIGICIADSQVNGGSIEKIIMR